MKKFLRICSRIQCYQGLFYFFSILFRQCVITVRTKYYEKLKSQTQLLSIKVTFSMQSGVLVIHFFCSVLRQWSPRLARPQSAFYPHYSILRKTQSRPRTWQPRQIYILIVFFRGAIATRCVQTLVNCACCHRFRFLSVPKRALWKYLNRQYSVFFVRK